MCTMNDGNCRRKEKLVGSIVAPNTETNSLSFILRAQKDATTHFSVTRDTYNEAKTDYLTYTSTDIEIYNYKIAITNQS